jgi:rubrerythrin
MLLSGIMLPAIWAAKLNSPEGHSPVEVTALAALFIALILTFINWRCPACNRYLFRRIYPRSCPGCGVAFRD